ncbi:hypothetical protein ASE00_12855 [Sphingomonas sp. Root710]|uniref:transcriptional regulator domain-containing protein n=1 Tax=Sphingomonas sp. Root710 TaxID=1736594 RepID=UPI0006F9A9D8|nr:DUF6499 domain-containing protein [Sphingomonas sp. Root710]KRB82887.1 hypothetical protein ASE00_12855 [Sphingomonas sp. Root710]
MTDSDVTPNWQDSRLYQPLTGFDHAGLAWEFVRRNADYRAAAMKLGTVSGDTRAGTNILPGGFPGGEPWGLSFR